MSYTILSLLFIILVAGGVTIQDYLKKAKNKPTVAHKTNKNDRNRDKMGRYAKPGKIEFYSQVVLEVTTNGFTRVQTVDLTNPKQVEIWENDIISQNIRIIKYI